MATSKTLTPTNVTIQIPEFTDQPDQRVNSNCLDKEADAINALNTQITLCTKQVYSNYSATAKTHTITLSEDVGMLLYVFYWGGSNNTNTGMYMIPVMTGTTTNAVAIIKAASNVTITVSGRTITVDVANQWTSVVACIV